MKLQGHESQINLIKGFGEVQVDYANDTTIQDQVKDFVKL